MSGNEAGAEPAPAFFALALTETRCNPFADIEKQG